MNQETFINDQSSDNKDRNTDNFDACSLNNFVLKLSDETPVVDNDIDAITTLPSVINSEHNNVNNKCNLNKKTSNKTFVSDNDIYVISTVPNKNSSDPIVGKNDREVICLDAPLKNKKNYNFRNQFSIIMYKFDPDFKLSENDVFKILDHKMLNDDIIEIALRLFFKEKSIFLIPPQYGRKILIDGDISNLKVTYFKIMLCFEKLFNSEIFIV